MKNELKILIVTDDYTFKSRLITGLLQSGYSNIIVEKTLLSAFAEINSNNFNLIISEEQLSDGMGYELSNKREYPLIILSEYDLDISTVIENGADDFLLKANINIINIEQVITRIFYYWKKINQLHFMETALSEESQLSSMIFDQYPNGLIIADKNFNIIDLNEKSINMFDIDVMELSSIKGLLKLSNKDLKNIETGSIFKLQLERNSFTYQISITRIQGSFINLKAQYLVVIENISSIVNVTKTLGIQYNFIRDLFDAIPSPVCYKDKNQIILNCNSAYAAILGKSDKEIIGHRLDEIIDNKSIRDLIEREKNVIRNKQKIEYQLDLSEPGDLNFLISKTPIFAINGDVVGILTMFTDITELIKTQAVNKDLQEKYMHAQKMEAIGELAGGVAHDFNNMLTAILGFSDFLMKKINEDDFCFKIVAEIKKAGLRAARITSQLLAFSRRQVRNIRVINLNEEIKDMDKMLRRLLGESIKLSFNFDCKQNILFDLGQLEQIFLNLMVNCKDAISGQGEVSIETKGYLVDSESLEFEGIKSGEYILAIVKDTGCGIDEKNLKIIFQPFFTTKIKGQGTGLGLSTVFGIMKQNNGFVYVKSVIGTGTQFYLFFPSTDKKLEDTHTSELYKQQKDFTGTVLVLEDEDSVKHYITSVLKDYGFTVYTASNITEASELLQINDIQISLIISDLNLGGVSGKKIIDNLKIGMPYFFITGYMNTNDFSSDQDIILAKPFSEDQLINTVIKVLHEK